MGEPLAGSASDRVQEALLPRVGLALASDFALIFGRIGSYILVVGSLPFQRTPKEIIAPKASVTVTDPAQQESF